MPSEEDHHSERNGAAKPFFSGGQGDPTASYGDAAIGPGAQIGPYKLLGILGEGGYGIVYLAEQERPIRRRVALKVVKPGMDSRQVVARFEAERQALALLDHPNIAHVYDAGTTSGGRPYFAMEYIEGFTITEYCDGERLDLRERLRLFRQVCDAVQHAHQKGIIHRDLKPSNILVAAEDDKPLVKVIDFGIAKALAQPLTEKTLYTERGQFIGTPDYMSPEQADMAAQGVDTRSDVYSLGVVLYELLTGVLPFDPKELRTGGLAHIQAVLRNEEPRTPSTRLTGLGEESRKIAARRLTDVRTLTLSLRRELEWIPLKAMRKEPSRRYQSVSELASDIANYLQGKPLSAGPESVVYLGKKFVRRHIGAIAVAAVVVISLLIGLTVSTTMYLKAERMRVIADDSRQAAEKSQAEGVVQRQVAERERDRAVRAESEARVLLAESYEQQGRQHLELGRLNEALLYLADALQTHDRLSTRLLLAKGIRQRGLPLDLEEGQGCVNWAREGNSDQDRRFAVSPDRSLYALEDLTKHTVDVYDTMEGHLQSRLDISGLEQLTFTPDNRHIVARVAQNEIYHQLRIFDLDRGVAVGTVSRTNVDVNDFCGNLDSPPSNREELRSVYSSICMEPGGAWFAFASSNKSGAGWDWGLQLWDLREGKLNVSEAGYSDGPVTAIAAGARRPEGGVDINLFTLHYSHELHRWYLPSLMHRDGSGSWPRRGEFSPCGRWILLQSGDTATLLDRRLNIPVKSFDRIAAIGFSPDGERLVTKQFHDPCSVGSSDEDCVTSLWDTVSGKMATSIQGPEVVNWHFTPDSQHLITEHADGQVRVWWSDDGTPTMNTPAGRWLQVADISCDGSMLLTCERERPDRVQLWDLTVGDWHELDVPHLEAMDLSRGFCTVELDAVFANSHVPPRVPVRFNANETSLITPSGLTPLRFRTLAPERLKSAVEAFVSVRLESGRVRQASPKEILSSRLQHYQAAGGRDDPRAIGAAFDLIVYCIQNGQLEGAHQIIADLSTALAGGTQGDGQRLQKAIRELSQAYCLRGEIRERQGQYRVALMDLQSTVALQPDDAHALNVLAWHQVTCPEENLRQPELALENAKRACALSNWNQWDCLSTYAVVLAGQGRFSEAARWQEKAIQLLPSAERSRWEDNYRRRLNLFRQESPYEQRHFWKLPTRDLVGWWKFSEGAGHTPRDSSGNSPEGTLVGNVRWEGDSFHNGLYFGGDGSHVDCGAHPVGNIADAITVAAWVKAGDNSDVQWRSFLAGNGTWVLSRRRERGILEFSCAGVFTDVVGLDGSGIQGNSPIEVAQWHHVAAVFDGSALYLYLDGRQDAVEPASGRMRVDPEHEVLRIGGHPLRLRDSWKGLIVDFRIYQRALNAKELASLYKQTIR